MNNHEIQITAIQTKNWQPFMNKMTARSRKQRKRLMQKRIRQAGSKAVNKNV